MTDYAPTINENGISAPLYETVFAGLQADYRGIFGQDLTLDPSTQPGQWLAVLAKMQDDVNQAIIAAYNNQSPGTAVGVGLSSVVKINGLARQKATNSTVPVIIVGIAGTQIIAGRVRDVHENVWTLPAVVTIPVEGQIEVTATCVTEGAITATTGDVNRIDTSVPGWQTVGNPTDANVGNPVETDATLRRRQKISTGLPAQTPLEAIEGTVANVRGVGRTKAYENDTDATDIDGLPPHSIAVVVEGGDVQEVATAIAEKKSPGTGTYGDVSAVVLDKYGVPDTIRFFYLKPVVMTVEVTLKPLTGYLDTTAAEIKNSVAAFINSLDIGYDVYRSKLYTAADLDGDPLNLTYDVLSVKIGRGRFSWNTPNVGWNQGVWNTGLVEADAPVDFNEAATCDPASVSVIVQP